MVDEIINVLKEKQCYGCEHWYYECQIPWDGCERFLKLLPDEIAELAEHLEKNDVVKVVRCKDCLHFLSDTEYCKEHNKGYCELDNTVKSKNHFCGYGERLEADGDKNG